MRIGNITREFIDDIMNKEFSNYSYTIREVGENGFTFEYLTSYCKFLGICEFYYYTDNGNIFDYKITKIVIERFK